MLDTFDIDLDINFDFDNEIKDEFIKINHNVRPISIIYENADVLAQEINIKKGETVFVNTTGKFVFGEFIASFIIENNLDVEELHVISLSGGLDNFESFNDLIEKGWVEQIKIILSAYFFRTEMRKKTETVNYLAEISKKHKENLKVWYTNTHAKIVLIRTKMGGKVTMSGSANLRSSQSLEQLIIQENADLYDWQLKYFNTLIKNT